MEQLLRISTTRAKVGYTINEGVLNYNNSKPECTMTRTKGGFKMSNTPAKLNIDNFDCYNSINPTTKTSIAQNASKGKQAATAAAQSYTNQGAMFLKAQPGEDVIQQIVQNAMYVNTGFTIGFTPSAPPKISYQPGKLMIDYTVDKLSFDWRNLQGSFDFTPGSIDFHMEQMPDVTIEYIGEPMYVPKSADPSRS